MDRVFCLDDAKTPATRQLAPWMASLKDYQDEIIAALASGLCAAALEEVLGINYPRG